MIHPEAQALRDRLQKLRDQGKVCPVCGGGLQIFQPSKDGMLDGEPLVSLECSENRTEINGGCWDWHPTRHDSSIDPEREHMYMEYLETQQEEMNE